MLVKMFVALLLNSLFFSPVLAQEGMSYSADRFDVAVAVQSGGSLQVTEQVDFRFDGGPFTFVFRELPIDRTDGIGNIQAGVDGVIWPLGNQPSQVEIEEGDPIRITWHLPPTSDSNHTFDLRYDVAGVARRGNGTDILDWQALPEEYDYTIGSSEIVFTYPASAALQGDPSILEGDGIISTSGNSVRISAVDLGPDEPLVARLTFEEGSLITTLPVWQAQQQAADSRAWIWVVLGGLTLLGGSFYLIRSTRPFRSNTPDVDGLAYAPPSKLAPALVGAISSESAGVSWQHALATLFDFAGRGYLTIEELADRKWYQGKDFLVTMDSWPVDVLPHEQALLDMVFRDKSGTPIMTVSGTEIGNAVSTSKWNTYKDAVRDELILTNLVDPKRQDVIYRYLRIGLVLMFLAIALMVPAFLVRAQFGLWTLLLLGAILLLGFFSFIVASTISTRTASGEQAAAVWAPFKRYLERASRGKEEIAQPSQFEKYLPFAMTYGVAEGWARQHAKAGWNDVPTYFRAINLDSDGQSAAFIAVLVASNSSGGSASASAAGAAGAAAGGGASGAG